MSHDMQQYAALILGVVSPTTSSTLHCKVLADLAASKEVKVGR